VLFYQKELYKAGTTLPAAMGIVMKVNMIAVLVLVGFAFGAERLIETMMDRGVKIKNKDSIHLYIMQLGDDAKKLALPLNIEARKK
jgi:histidyl-tRNA synthetase